MANIKAVIGLGFGDEGKGLVTEFLSSKSTNPLVVRYSGGQQAGHTVHRDGKSHVFSNFGSGTLSGAPTIWTEFCTVDPVGLINEFQKLLELGIEPTIYINRNAPVTTPYDMYSNQIDVNNVDNGTCGVGVGKTFQREEDFYNLSFSDLFYPKILEEKLKNIGKKYYKKSINLDRFYECIELIKSYPTNIQTIESSLSFNGDVIFESSQGLLLDQHYGFFPNVTRSNVGSTNIANILEDRVVDNIEYYLVTRAYQTRHGNGFMTNLDIPHNIEDNIYETNVNNKYQGEFRRSILDLDLLIYGMGKDNFITKSSRKVLVVTCLDNLKESYQYTFKGVLYSYKDEFSFLNTIKARLGFDKVLISHSPISSEIEEF